MDLREECLGAKKIGISGHIRPDGDCVGVCLSLQMYLRKLLPEAEVTVYLQLSLIHISEPTRLVEASRMPSSA